ncbi:hypothetical protein B0H13DRAFT_2663658, partial [Mycena leptocephala]
MRRRAKPRVYATATHRPACAACLRRSRFPAAHVPPCPPLPSLAQSFPAARSPCPPLRLTTRTTNRMRSPPSSLTPPKSAPSTPRGSSPQYDTYLLPPPVFAAAAAG